MVSEVSLSQGANPSHEVPKISHVLETEDRIGGYKEPGGGAGPRGGVTK